MNSSIKIFAVLALLLVGGCQTTQPPVMQTFAAPVIPTAQPLNLRPVKWKVYTKADLKKIVADMDKHPEKEMTLYGLTEDGYKSLSSNMVDIERYMKEKGAIEIYLKKTLKERENIGQPTPGK